MSLNKAKKNIVLKPKTTIKCREDAIQIRSPHLTWFHFFQNNEPKNRKCRRHNFSLDSSLS